MQTQASSIKQAVSHDTKILGKLNKPADFLAGIDIFILEPFHCKIYGEYASSWDVL